MYEENYYYILIRCVKCILLKSFRQKSPVKERFQRSTRCQKQVEIIFWLYRHQTIAFMIAANNDGV